MDSKNTIVGLIVCVMLCITCIAVTWIIAR